MVRLAVVQLVQVSQEAVKAQEVEVEETEVVGMVVGEAVATEGVVRVAVRVADARAAGLVEIEAASGKTAGQVAADRVAAARTAVVVAAATEATVVVGQQARVHMAAARATEPREATSVRVVEVMAVASRVAGTEAGGGVVVMGSDAWVVASLAVGKAAPQAVGEGVGEMAWAKMARVAAEPVG